MIKIISFYLTLLILLIKDSIEVDYFNITITQTSMTRINITNYYEDNNITLYIKKEFNGHPLIFTQLTTSIINSKLESLIPLAYKNITNAYNVTNLNLINKYNYGNEGFSSNPLIYEILIKKDVLINLNTVNTPLYIDFQTIYEKNNKVSLLNSSLLLFNLDVPKYFTFESMTKSISISGIYIKFLNTNEKKTIKLDYSNNSSINYTGNEYFSYENDNLKSFLKSFSIITTLNSPIGPVLLLINNENSFSIGRSNKFFRRIPILPQNKMIYLNITTKFIYNEQQFTYFIVNNTNYILDFSIEFQIGSSIIKYNNIKRFILLNKNDFLNQNDKEITAKISIKIKEYSLSSSSNINENNYIDYYYTSDTTQKLEKFQTLNEKVTLYPNIIQKYIFDLSDLIKSTSIESKPFFIYMIFKNKTSLSYIYENNNCLNIFLTSDDPGSITDDSIINNITIYKQCNSLGSIFKIELSKEYISLFKSNTNTIYFCLFLDQPKFLLSNNKNQYVNLEYFLNYELQISDIDLYYTQNSNYLNVLSYDNDVYIINENTNSFSDMSIYEESLFREDTSLIVSYKRLYIKDNQLSFSLLFTNDYELINTLSYDIPFIVKSNDDNQFNFIILKVKKSNIYNPIYFNFYLSYNDNIGSINLNSSVIINARTSNTTEVNINSISNITNINDNAYLELRCISNCSKINYSINNDNFTFSNNKLLRHNNYNNKKNIKVLIRNMNIKDEFLIVTVNNYNSLLFDYEYDDSFVDAEKAFVINNSNLLYTKSFSITPKEKEKKYFKMNIIDKDNDIQNVHFKLDYSISDSKSFSLLLSKYSYVPNKSIYSILLDYSILKESSFNLNTHIQYKKTMKVGKNIKIQSKYYEKQRLNMVQFFNSTNNNSLYDITEENIIKSNSLILILYTNKLKKNLIISTNDFDIINDKYDSYILTSSKPFLNYINPRLRITLLNESISFIPIYYYYNNSLLSYENFGTFENSTIFNRELNITIDQINNKYIIKWNPIYNSSLFNITYSIYLLKDNQQTVIDKYNYEKSLIYYMKYNNNSSSSLVKSISNDNEYDLKYNEYYNGFNYLIILATEDNSKLIRAYNKEIITIGKIIEYNTMTILTKENKYKLLNIDNNNELIDELYIITTQRKNCSIKISQLEYSQSYSLSYSKNYFIFKFENMFSQKEVLLELNEDKKDNIETLFLYKNKQLPNMLYTINRLDDLITLQILQNITFFNEISINFNINSKYEDVRLCFKSESFKIKSLITYNDNKEESYSDLNIINGYSIRINTNYTLKLTLKEINSIEEVKYLYLYCSKYQSTNTIQSMSHYKESFISNSISFLFKIKLPFRYGRFESFRLTYFINNINENENDNITSNYYIKYIYNQTLDNISDSDFNNTDLNNIHTTSEDNRLLLLNDFNKKADSVIVLVNMTVINNKKEVFSLKIYQSEFYLTPNKIFYYYIDDVDTQKNTLNFTKIDNKLSVDIISSPNYFMKYNYIYFITDKDRNIKCNLTFENKYYENITYNHTITGNRLMRYDIYHKDIVLSNDLTKSKYTYYKYTFYIECDSFNLENSYNISLTLYISDMILYEYDISTNDKSNLNYHINENQKLVLFLNHKYINTTFNYILYSDDKNTDYYYIRTSNQLSLIINNEFKDKNKVNLINNIKIQNYSFLMFNFKNINNLSKFIITNDNITTLYFEESYCISILNEKKFVFNNINNIKDNIIFNFTIIPYEKDNNLTIKFDNNEYSYSLVDSINKITLNYIPNTMTMTIKDTRNIQLILSSFQYINLDEITSLKEYLDKNQDINNIPYSNNNTYTYYLNFPRHKFLIFNFNFYNVPDSLSVSLYKKLNYDNSLYIKSSSSYSLIKLVNSYTQIKMNNLDEDIIIKIKFNITPKYNMKELNTTIRYSLIEEKKIINNKDYIFLDFSLYSQRKIYAENNQNTIGIITYYKITNHTFNCYLQNQEQVYKLNETLNYLIINERITNFTLYCSSNQMFIYSTNLENNYRSLELKKPNTSTFVLNHRRLEDESINNKSEVIIKGFDLIESNNIKLQLQYCVLLNERDTSNNSSYFKLDSIFYLNNISTLNKICQNINKFDDYLKFEVKTNTTYDINLIGIENETNYIYSYDQQILFIDTYKEIINIRKRSNNHWIIFGFNIILFIIFLVVLYLFLKNKPKEIVNK